MDTTIVCVMVVLSEADFVLSATEVAVIVTAPLLPGTEFGAVYVVATPLAVCVGLKEPQEPAGAQLQFTPSPSGSFCTAAVTDALLLISMYAGGAWVMVTTIGALMVMAAEAKTALSELEVAVTVTEPPLGTEDGAV
jgi:hypothetical protein